MILLVLLLFSLDVHAQVVSLKKSAWDLRGYWLDPPKSVQYNSGPVFDFPQDVPSAGLFRPRASYLVHAWNKPVTISGTVTASFRITTTGAPIYNYNLDNEICSPLMTPHARLYFEQDKWWDFDFSQPHAGDTYRWWSNPISYELTGDSGGVVTLIALLDPSQWSSVWGHFGSQDSTTLAGFQAATQNTVGIGLAFGGGCSFGHGVNVSNGTATFELLSFSVSP